MQNVNVPTVYGEKVPKCIQMNKRLKEDKIHRSNKREKPNDRSCRERVGRKGDIYKERKPRLHFDAPGQPLLKPVQPFYFPLLHLVKAATTAHSSSLVLFFMLSPSGSRSSSCRTLFMARSYWSSRSGANAFSSTSEEWARNIRARMRLSIR